MNLNSLPSGFSEENASTEIREQCRMCFCPIEVTEEHTSSIDPYKLYRLCCKYLHSTVTHRNNGIHSENSEDEMCFSLCTKCIKSSTKLSHLASKLEFFQDCISELTLLFSLGILNRRAHFATRDVKYLSDTFEFDASKLPLHTFFPMSKYEAEFTESSVLPTTQNETETIVSNTEVENSSFIDIDEAQFEDIKYESQDIISVDNCFTSDLVAHFQNESQLGKDNTPGKCHQIENSGTTAGPSTSLKSKIGLPTLKLKKLQIERNKNQRLITQGGSINDFQRDIEESKEMIFESVESVCPMGSNNDNLEPPCILGLTSNHDLKIGVPNCADGVDQNEVSILKRKNVEKIVTGFEVDLINAYANQQVNSILKKRGDPQKKIFQCSFCKKKLSSRAALRRHRRFVHCNQPSSNCPTSDRDAFKCPVCNKNFKYKNNMELHVKNHSLVKPFQCDMCTYSTVRADYLRNHKATHAESCRYSCRQCGRIFNTEIATKNHYRRMHSTLDFTEDCVIGNTS